MTCRHRFKLSGVSSAIAIALVIAFATAARPLSVRADPLEASSLQPERASETTSPGVADLLSLAFIAMLWTLHHKAARHHRSLRPRRRTRTAM